MQDFQLDKHQKKLGTGLRPDPLGELKRSPRPPSRKTGAYFYGEGRGKGGEGKGRGGEREGREGRDPPRVGGHPPHFQILKNTLHCWLGDRKGIRTAEEPRTKDFQTVLFGRSSGDMT